MTLPDTEGFTSIVGRVFKIEEVTLGDPKVGYFLRYRGELLRDSQEAYDQLAAALLPLRDHPALPPGRQAARPSC